MTRTSCALATAALIVLTGCSSGGGSTTGPAKTSATGPVVTATRLPASLAAAKGWLVYSTFINDQDRIHLAKVDGSAEFEAFTDVDGETIRAAFSPDGKQLAFEHRPPGDGGHNIYIGKADGTGAHVVAQCAAGACERESPAWSPDGKYLASAVRIGQAAGETPEPESGLGIIEVSTGTVRVLLRHPSAQSLDQLVRWSPDGHRLVFHRWRAAPGKAPFQDTPDAQAAVFVVNADGTNLKQLTPWDLRCGDPDWSPDGSQIICATFPPSNFETGQGDIYLMKADGSGLQALTKNGTSGVRDAQPRFTPDGKVVLYVHATHPTWFSPPRHIYVLDLTTGRSTPVLTARNFYTRPSLQPQV